MYLRCFFYVQFFLKELKIQKITFDMFGFLCAHFKIIDQFY
jgi:hypothetical protein